MTRIAHIAEPCQCNPVIEMTLVSVTTVPHNIYMLNAGGSERRPGAFNSYIQQQNRIASQRRALVRALGVVLVLAVMWFVYHTRFLAEQWERVETR